MENTIQFEIVPAREGFSYEINDDDTKHWLTELVNSPLHCVLVALCASSVCGWIVVE
ncbi:hypothetical protein [Pseudoalteromonas byunsanensis]|uniref:hypothetical protein n=1 Tax=Pseudoalteromonas byunsanensis TaxID=327939 RepID=UPI001585D7A3|nr:hypothetical protein [Pseudoalteromonas byunsanensis]